jgi:hypothetical protein
MTETLQKTLTHTHTHTHTLTHTQSPYVTLFHALLLPRYYTPYISLSLSLTTYLSLSLPPSLSLPVTFFNTHSLTLFRSPDITNYIFLSHYLSQSFSPSLSSFYLSFSLSFSYSLSHHLSPPLTLLFSYSLSFSLSLSLSLSRSLTLSLLSLFLLISLSLSRSLPLLSPSLSPTLSVSLSSSPSLSSFQFQLETHTHTHTGVMSLIEYVPGCHSLDQKNLALMEAIKLGTLLGSSSTLSANGSTEKGSRDRVYCRRCFIDKRYNEWAWYRMRDGKTENKVCYTLGICEDAPYRYRYRKYMNLFLRTHNGSLADLFACGGQNGH